MNFDLSDDQRMLKDTARSFLERECASAKLRALLDDPRGSTDELWSKIVELGWLGLAVPEAYGGIGLGFLDLAVVLEEAGRALLPGPFFSTAVLAGSTLADGGSEAQKQRWLPEIAAGRAIGAAAVWEEGGAWTPQAIEAKARKTKTGYALSGRKCAVLDAHVADFLLVAAKLGTGVALFLVERGAKGLAIEPMKTVDGTRRIAHVTLTGVKLSEDALVGGNADAWPLLSRTLDRAAAGMAAEMVGGAGKTLEMSVDYAKIRVQFGRPIGSFQAIKHKCADMMLLVE
ncbi:MAG: acyl-CoA dehydrogenase family protein, partial [bacterium]